MSFKVGDRFYVVEVNRHCARFFTPDTFEATVVAVKRKYATIHSDTYNTDGLLLDMETGSILKVRGRGGEKTLFGKAHASREEYETNAVLSHVWRESIKLLTYNISPEIKEQRTPQQILDAFRILLGETAYALVLDGIKAKGLSPEAIAAMRQGCQQQGI